LTRWKAKAALQAVFSRVPGGEALNYLCQRRIFGNLPVGDDTFRATVASAADHLDKLRAHGPLPVDQARFYEFGAGKDLIIPLAYYCMGVNEQVLVDIRHLAREELVVDTLRRLCDGVVPGLVRTPEPALSVQGLDRRLAALGITYQAPCDARGTGFPDGAVDYATSTSTLEHIGEADLRSILQETRRILRPDGLVSSLVDYQDHYSYADSSISVYNFLQYEDGAWARWSPSLQFQNRLRHHQYLALFDAAGFDVVEDNPTPGSPEDLEVIAGLPLAGPFRDMAPADLAVRRSLVVLRPRP
jgi:SAM-dependent methyltransferase